MSVILEVLDHWCFENGPLTEAARKEYSELQERLRADREAFERIVAIKNRTDGGDWEEIELARDIAEARLESNDG